MENKFLSPMKTRKSMSSKLFKLPMRLSGSWNHECPVTFLLVCDPFPFFLPDTVARQPEAAHLSISIIDQKTISIYIAYLLCSGLATEPCC